MVRPYAEPHEADRDPRKHDHGIPEQRLAGERRQDLGNDTHGGQDQDVDLGMAEQPEQVLP